MSSSPPVSTSASTSHFSNARPSRPPRPREIAASVPNPPASSIAPTGPRSAAPIFTSVASNAIHSDIPTVFTSCGLAYLTAAVPSYVSRATRSVSSPEDEISESTPIYCAPSFTCIRDGRERG